MSIKFISWNVNGFRAAAASGHLATLVRNHKPDVLCVQEIKCTEDELARAADMYVPELTTQYERFVLSSAVKGRHGVAMFIKTSVIQRNGEYFSIPYDGVDPLVDGNNESRLQMIQVFDTLIINTYSVNVRQNLSRIPQRKVYDDVLSSYVSGWNQQGLGPVIVLGDLNVVAEAIDYHGGRINESLAGMTRSERDSFSSLKESGKLVDSFRHLYPEDSGVYSYWSYRGYARESNKGWRIDYALVSESLQDKILDADVLMETGGSDHAPIILELDFSLEVNN